MDDIERIYLLLLHSNGLKIRVISKELELDKYYVTEILLSPQNTPYWYQDDDSLWFAKEGSLQVEEPKEKSDDLFNPVEKPQKYNITRFHEEDLSDSLRAYLYQISKYRVYSNDKIIELFKRYKDGNKGAYDLIIKSHLRYVANIALLYCRKGAPLEDIIQEGNIGLIKATERFDYTQNSSFLNYAKAWILQAISYSLSTIPFMVRLPLNQLTLYRKIQKFKEHFEQLNEYPPSLNDIEVDEDVDITRIALLYSFPDNLKTLVELHDDMDFIGSNMNSETLNEDNEYNKYMAHKYLNSLENRRKNIVRFYYGIDSEEETLSSIGEKMKLSRERVRQLIWNSIRSMQDASHVKRKEAKVGDQIQILSSKETGRVIKVKNSDDGSIILVLKMKLGHTNEISVDETPYKVITDAYKKNSNLNPVSPVSHQNNQTTIDSKSSKPKIEKKTANNASREVNKLYNLKVGDSIYYNKKYCTIKKIIKIGHYSKLIIEYTNTIRDVIFYNKNNKSKIVKVTQQGESSHSNNLSQTNNNSIIPENVKVGDRIIYKSKPCKVIEKRRKYSIILLSVKYDDGRIEVINYLK